MKLQLATYNLSGNDTTKWFNKWMRRLGQAPVIYDSTLTDMSTRQLKQALINKGYNDAVVTSSTTFKDSKKKADVTYNITTGSQHFISDIYLEETATMHIQRTTFLSLQTQPLIRKMYN